MVPVRLSVESAATPRAKRSASAGLVVVLTAVLFTAGTACNSSGSSSPLVAPELSGPQGTPPPPSPTTSGLQQGARDIAHIAVGEVGLPPLKSLHHGKALAAICKPRTTKNDVAIMTASCKITYSDGSVWLQTVFIEFDGQGNPVFDRHDVGTEVLPPPSAPPSLST